MLRQCAILLAIGTILVVLGGVLFLNLFNNEPLWSEWLLGPFVVCVGFAMAIVGIALHCYSRESERNAAPAAGGND